MRMCLVMCRQGARRILMRAGAHHHGSADTASETAECHGARQVSMFGAMVKDLPTEFMLLDSGSNCHISPNRDKMCNFRGHTTNIKTPGGLTTAHGTGTMRIDLGHTHLLLDDVLHAQQSSHIVLSLSKLIASGIKCDFEHMQVTLPNGHKVRILCRNGLYFIRAQTLACNIRHSEGGMLEPANTTAIPYCYLD
jgi:hypothetical protein